MKKFLSKAVLLCLVLVMSLGISTVAFAYDEQEITTCNEQYLNSWNVSDFNQYLSEDLEEEDLEKFTSWQNVKDSLGELQSIDGTVITEEDGVLTAVTTATYENNKLEFTLTYDTATVEAYGAMYGVTDIDAKLPSAGGEASMAKAAMNTLMGMGIVFAVLILISLVISLLKYIPMLLDKLTGKAKKEEVKEAVVETQAPVVSENLVDDTELVAVISAAIAAYEADNAVNVGPDGFVVRSIRRRR